MASLSTAVSRTVGMIPTAAMVVIGSLAATVATDVGREMYDIEMKGGDSAYPIIAAIGLNAFTRGRTTRMVSIGMVSTSITNMAREWGMV